MAPTTSSAGRYVLLVDDDALTRAALSLVLDADGCAVREAANGEEALRLLGEPPPPFLILLDLIMPVMDGASFRRRQLADAVLANIPVVIFSAAADLGQRAADLGVADWLHKPLDPDALLLAVRRFRPNESV
jgi:CheY-like chemotaxis protein